MEATAGPSSIRFGFTDPCLTTQVGLIVWPHFPRQVGFRAAHGGTPPSFIDQPHRLSSPRHRLAIPERSGTADIGAFGEIALPPELAGPWPVCGETCVPAPKTSQVGTDLRAVRRRRHWRFRRNRLTPGARLSLASLWRELRSCPEGLSGGDRSLSGPAPQTLAHSEKSPYLGSGLG